MRHCNTHVECPIQKNRNITDNHDHTLTTTTTWPLLPLPQSFIRLLSPTCSRPSPPEPCRSLLPESHNITTATTKTQPRCMAGKQESGVTASSLRPLLSHKNRHTTAIPASLSPTTASFSLITCHLLNLVLLAAQRNCITTTTMDNQRCRRQQWTTNDADDNNGQPTMLRTKSNIQ